MFFSRFKKNYIQLIMDTNHNNIHDAQFCQFMNKYFRTNKYTVLPCVEH